MGLNLTVRGHVAEKSASLGVFDREFRGKEQQEKPRVREFREFGTASLRGLSVLLSQEVTRASLCLYRMEWVKCLMGDSRMNTLLDNVRKCLSILR